MSKEVDMTIAVDQHIADFINTQPVTQGVNVTFTGSDHGKWQVVTANGKQLFFTGTVVEGQKRDGSGGNGDITYVMDIGTLSKPKFKLTNKPNSYFAIAQFIFGWAVQQGVAELTKAKEADARDLAEIAANDLTENYGDYSTQFQGGCATDVDGNVTPAVWLKLNKALSIDKVIAIMNIVKS